jgi:hypothetical protein
VRHCDSGFRVERAGPLAVTTRSRGILSAITCARASEWNLSQSGRQHFGSCGYGSWLGLAEIHVRKDRHGDNVEREQAEYGCLPLS